MTSYINAGDFCFMGLPDYCYYERLLRGMYYLGNLRFCSRLISR